MLVESWFYWNQKTTEASFLFQKYDLTRKGLTHVYLMKLLEIWVILLSQGFSFDIYHSLWLYHWEKEKSSYKAYAWWGFQIILPILQEGLQQLAVSAILVNTKDHPLLTSPKFLYNFINTFIIQNVMHSASLKTLSIDTTSKKAQQNHHHNQLIR